MCVCLHGFNILRFRLLRLFHLSSHHFTLLPSSYSSFSSCSCTRLVIYTLISLNETSLHLLFLCYLLGQTLSFHSSFINIRRLLFYIITHSFNALARHSPISFFLIGLTGNLWCLQITLLYSLSLSLSLIYSNLDFVRLSRKLSSFRASKVDRFSRSFSVLFHQITFSHPFNLIVFFFISNFLSNYTWTTIKNTQTISLSLFTIRSTVILTMFFCHSLPFDSPLFFFRLIIFSCPFFAFHPNPSSFRLVRFGHFPAQSSFDVSVFAYLIFVWFRFFVVHPLHRINV